MNRPDLHQHWLEDAIAVRMKYRSYQTPVGKKELEALKRELALITQAGNSLKETLPLMSP
jgi:hypothetical protein